MGSAETLQWILAQIPTLKQHRNYESIIQPDG
jgi:hypothetical protein